MENTTPAVRLGVMVHQYEVLGHGELTDHSVAHPFLRYIGQTGSPNLPRSTAGNFVVVEADPTPGDRAQPGQRLGQLALTVARDTCDAHNLPSSHIDGKIVHSPPTPVALHVKAFDGQPHSTLLGGFLVGRQLDRSAHHHPGQLLLGGRLRLGLTDHPAIAQHGDPIGEGQYLVELVGDEDQAPIVVGHPAQNDEELLDLLRGQDGGRLVKDQETALTVEGLDDLDALTLPHRKLPHVGLRIDS